MSRLSITARGPHGQPMAGLSIRVDALVADINGNLVVADFGTLSSRWATTGSTGRAEVTYQAPGPPSPGVSTDRAVTLRATPLGSDYAAGTARSVTVLLMRPGDIRPPTRMVPRFTVSPSNPRESDTVHFDASSSSDPDGQIASFAWEFGDGKSGTGRTGAHEYEMAGTYGVVLTVRDAYGTGVSTAPTLVTVSSSPAPVAAFTVSPTDPGIGTPVVFNAAASTAPVGRRIVDYSWDLGDGTLAEGVALRHSYETAGTFTAVLTITDSTGRRAVASLTIPVSDLNSPVADFTVSPATPSVGDTVVFNAAASTVPGGRQIVAYAWDFGDATEPGFSAALTHVFVRPGTYTVVLTVTDNTGRKGVKSMVLTVVTPPASPGG